MILFSCESNGLPPICGIVARRRACCARSFDRDNQQSGPININRDICPAWSSSRSLLPINPIVRSTSCERAVRLRRAKETEIKKEERRAQGWAAGKKRRRIKGTSERKREREREREIEGRETKRQRERERERGTRGTSRRRVRYCVSRVVQH